VEDGVPVTIIFLKYGKNRQLNVTRLFIFGIKRAILNLQWCKLTNELGINGSHKDPCLNLSIQNKCVNDTIKEIIRMVKFNKYTIKISIKLETGEIIHFKN